MLSEGIPVLGSDDIGHCLIIGPDPSSHDPLVVFLGCPCRLMDIVVLSVLGRAMFIAKRLEDHTAIQDGERTLAGLHLKIQPGPSSAGNMKSLIAVLVAALYAGTHSLMADVTCQLPPVLRDLLHIHDRLHECVIPERDFGDPHCTKQMGPFRGIGLLKGTIMVGTEDTCLMVLAHTCQNIRD